MGTLNGQVAFITGAPRDGPAHAVKLASEGADIAVDVCAEFEPPTIRALPPRTEETVKLVERQGRRIIARRPTCVTPKHGRRGR